MISVAESVLLSGLNSTVTVDSLKMDDRSRTAAQVDFVHWFTAFQFKIPE
jgi:hypothetical protein